MPSLPESWGLKQKKAPNGKTQIVGTNAMGSEYVARTCEGDGVTDHDLQILDLGNPEKQDADKFVGYYRDQRDNARKNWEHSLDQEYNEAAEQVVHAGFHMKDSKLGYSRAYAAKFDQAFGEN